jgi:hypothetical protein
MKREGEIFELSGGLGNQLFQFSAGLARSFKFNRSVNFDVSRISHGVTAREESISKYINVKSSLDAKFQFFHSSIPRIYDVLTHKVNLARTLDQIIRPSYQSLEIGFDVQVLENKSFSVYRGYFQSWRYLETLQEMGVEIDLALPKFSSDTESLINEIDFENDIAVHVRRGDYAQFAQSIGLLSPNYFLNALDLLGSDRRIFVFSDSAEIGAEFPARANLTFTPHLSRVSSVESLNLMKGFKRIVISNSTFSWWAAALGRSDKSVIAPSTWYRKLSTPKDLIPRKWNQIESVWTP